MISLATLHSFISHFPSALFVAGLVLLAMGKMKSNPKWIAAASINFSFGLLTVVLATFTGLFSADLNMMTTEEIESHQGYSIVFVFSYVACTIYSYTNPYSPTALFFYFFNFLAMGASIWSGYLLVFYSTG